MDNSTYHSKYDTDIPVVVSKCKKVGFFPSSSASTPLIFDEVRRGVQLQFSTHDCHHPLTAKLPPTHLLLFYLHPGDTSCKQGVSHKTSVRSEDLDGMVRSPGRSHHVRKGVVHEHTKHTEHTTWSTVPSSRILRACWMCALCCCAQLYSLARVQC